MSPWRTRGSETDEADNPPLAIWSRRGFRSVLLMSGMTVVAVAGARTPLVGQHPVESTEWSVINLRDYGQPVIPIFDGWWQNPDGMYTLCFSYFSMNLEEVVDIPLGQDNFIEPSRFDGSQPTHFRHVPTGEAKYRRQWCTFTVDVPEDFGSQDVIWTLRNRGQTFTVPGHVASPHYILDEPDSGARGTVAPVMQLVQPASPEGRGRRQSIDAGPLSASATARVGSPLVLTVAVSTPDGASPPDRWWVGWSKHQGPPGSVRFDNQDAFVSDGGRVTTTATFVEPGSYVLRVAAIISHTSFEFHCCWTNGYVRVTVTE